MHANTLVFWDIDGTLMHCGSDGTKALNATFRELFGVADAFSAAPVGASMDSVLIGGIMQSFGIAQGELPRIHEHYRKTLKRILAEDKKKQILPGVMPLLKTIDREPHFRNALLTSNLRIGALTKLESVGLCDFFEFGGFGDEPGEKWDAAERCIDRTAEACGVTFSREQIWLIGDSAYDVSCARFLGIKSIAVATGWMSRDQLLASGPDHFFDDLTETDRVLQTLGL